MPQASRKHPRSLHPKATAMTDFAQAKMNARRSARLRRKAKGKTGALATQLRFHAADARKSAAVWLNLVMSRSAATAWRLAR